MYLTAISTGIPVQCTLYTHHIIQKNMKYLHEKKYLLSKFSMTYLIIIAQIIYIKKYLLPNKLYYNI